MCKLKFSTDITEKRNFGKTIINQSLEIEVEYDPQENNFEVENVKLYENGKYVAEISKLLDKAEGSPLSTMIEAIDWREVYCDLKEDQKITFNKMPLRNEHVHPVFRDILNGVMR